MPMSRRYAAWCASPRSRAHGAKRVVGKIHGRFDQFSGAITVTEDGTPSVTAEIDVNSVDTGNVQREAHIKAADFFDVAQFPIATFVSSAVRADGDDYVLQGGDRKPPEFATGPATTSVTRSHYGIGMTASKSSATPRDVSKIWHSPTRAYYSVCKCK